MVAGKSPNDARLAGGMRVSAPRRSARFMQRAAAAAEAASASGKTQVVESSPADVSSPLQGANPTPEIVNHEQQDQIVEEVKHNFVPKPRVPKVPKNMNNKRQPKMNSKARKTGGTFARGGAAAQRPQNIGTNGWA